MSSPPPSPSASSLQPPAELTRIERMVGEIIGLRLLVTEMVALDSERGPTASSGALARLDDWRIGSDTPEGAERIRTYVRQMLSAFPSPVPVIQGDPALGAENKPA